MALLELENEKSSKVPKIEGDKIVVSSDDCIPELSYAFNCTNCNTTIKSESWSEPLSAACNQIISATDGQLRTAMSNDSWIEPSAQPCEHAFTLLQEITNKGGSCCTACPLEKNLWMCMTCGNLACGRRQFDGSGGNGHALQHFQETGHPVALKLGTIVYRGPEAGVEGDVYCYACDDGVQDPELKTHLQALGIDPTSSQKTELSTGELQVSLNLTHSYAMTDASGAVLEERSGPDCRGLVNLGNSCYFGSVLQGLRVVSGEAAFAPGHEYELCSSQRASDCLSCQLQRVYSSITSASAVEPVIKPAILKRLLCKSHPEFSSARQQDASEFLNWFLEESPAGRNIASQFRFQMLQKLECLTCGWSHSAKETLNMLTLSCDGDSKRADLFENLFAPTEIAEWKCEACCGSGACQSRHLISLPEHLIVVLNCVRVVNWVPEKVDCRVEGMSNDLLLKSTGDNSQQPSVNTEMLGELLMMGMEEEQARRALISCNNSSLEAAMNLIFDGGAIETVEAVEAKEEESYFNLKAFITHKGQSVHCGHYVAYCKQPSGQDEWLLFNDEKVAKIDANDDAFPVNRSYIYIYSKKQ